jgi:hypothetical protein
MSPQTIAAAAIDYARRGWKPVPIGRKSKKPTDKAWQRRPFAPEQFNGNGQNVAIQLGAASGGLTEAPSWRVHFPSGIVAIAVCGLPPPQIIIDYRA